MELNLYLKATAKCILFFGEWNYFKEEGVMEGKVKDEDWTPKELRTRREENTKY